MSVLLDATGDRLKRESPSDVPAWGDFSVMFWAWRVADQGDTEMLFGFANTGSGAPMAIYCDGGVTDKLGLMDGAFASTTGSGSAFTTGAWRRVAMTFNNTSNAFKLYEGDADPATNLTNTVSATYTGSFVIQVLTWPVHWVSGGTWFSGRIGAAKIYTAELSAAQLKTELAYFNIQDATNVWGAWNLKAHTDLTDLSGNGRTLSGTTLSTAADPPITDDPAAAGWGSLLGLRNNRLVNA